MDHGALPLKSPTQRVSIVQEPLPLPTSIRIRSALLALAVAGFLVTSVRPEAADSPSAMTGTWPQWRGPSRDGKLAGPAWPSSLSEDHLTQRWRVPLGPSYSGPIVGPHAVYVTETRDKRFERVTALDRSTGKELWHSEWEGSIEVPFFARKNGSWIRSTPALDGESLFVGGMQDTLICLSAKTGEKRWSIAFSKIKGAEEPAFGLVSSPLVVGSHVYAQGASSLYKIDSRTGEVVWETLKEMHGMMSEGAFSSPVLAEVHGRPQIVVQTRLRLAGVDPEDGKVLWSHEIDSFRGMHILTPTVFENKVFTSTYRGKSYLFELPNQAESSPLAEAWTNKAMGYMSSPVLVDGHLYLHLQNRRFSCIDTKSGKEAWRTSESFGEYWSLISNAGQILALDQTGELLLINANPQKFELADRRTVSKGETWGHLAAAGSQLFIRELNAISAYDWK